MSAVAYAKARVDTTLFPPKVVSIGIFSEPYPTQTRGIIYADVAEVSAETFQVAKTRLRAVLMSNAFDWTRRLPIDG